MAPLPRWLRLPATPDLPPPRHSGLAAVNGVSIWFAIFGTGAPVLFLHGGLANSNYWGHQVAALARHHQVVVLDSRGHGRSTRDGRPYSYALMTSDAMAVMDHLGIARVALVGWSDGAILGLDIAMKHPERLSRLFAFGANSDPGGVKDLSKSPVFDEFFARARVEYQSLSPTPGEYQRFLGEITRMWASEPHWTAADLARIAVPTWIVDADHNEAIERCNSEFMAAAVPGAGLLIQPEVSDFSMLQDPDQFTADILRFLARGSD